jgi:hypothetical protein
MKKYLLFLLVFAAFTACKKDSSGKDGSDDDGTKIDGWSSKAISDKSPTGDISAVCDKSDKLHVCIDGYDDRFYYCTNKSGSWVTTTILEKETSIVLTPSCGIAVDDDKHVHMIYCSYFNGTGGDTKLYYTTDKSGEMETEVIYTELSNGLSGMCIAATKDGNVHIVFGNVEMRLVYMTNVSGSWTSTIIDSYWTSVRPRIALDASENAYVVYEHGYENTVKMEIINSSGSPVSNTVFDYYGWSPKIAINPETDAVYVPYWDSNLEVMKLYNNGTIETIEACNWPEGGVAVDNSCNYHFTYSNLDDLQYVTNKSGSQVIETLPFKTATVNSNIVVESTGKVDIFYIDGTTYDLSVMSK